MKYVTGLVVGKFCPMHKGHELLINTALEQCDKVIVISYTSKSYKYCSASNRENWLTSLNPSKNKLEVHVLDDLITFPDEASEKTHRNFCANYLLNTLETTVQVVFTSEDYGQGFANYLSLYFTAETMTPLHVKHVMVDYKRKAHKISGTALRNAETENNFSLLKEMLSPVVYASYIRKILFLGGESTGKTTIVTALAKHFKTQAAEEFGRYLYDARKGKLFYEDMYIIGKSQLVVEDFKSMLIEPEQYVFCDTSPLTTQFYSLQWFGRCSSKLTNLVWDCNDRYYKIYLCAPDFPMVQDGTRQDEKFRAAGHEFYINELAGIEYTLLTGTLEEKINRVIKDLE